MLIYNHPELITAPVRTFQARVRAYNGSSLVYNFTHNDSVQAITITRAAEKNKFFGFGICQKANVKLRDPQRATNITTEHELVINIDQFNGMLSIFPNFKVTEVHRDENTNVASVTAYDGIYWAAQHTVAELNLHAPYTIEDMARAISTFLGFDDVLIDEAAATAFQLNYPNGANFDGTETLRAALDAMAEATQTVYFVDNTNSQNALRFRRLSTNAAELVIDKEQYITLSSKTNRRLSKIYHTTELGDDVYAALDETGTTQYVRDNPFWDMREDIGDLVDAALDAVGGLTINQFECNWRGNYLLEMCDCIGLVTKDNDVVYSFLLNDTVEYDGSFKQKSLWQYDEEQFETAENPSSLGEVLKKTYAKVDKVNKEIDLVASEVSANKSAIAAIKLDTESITGTVSSLEKNLQDGLEDASEDIAEVRKEVEAKITSDQVSLMIKNELDNGVSKVTTNTGYTFDDEGMTVSKSGSDMTTTITEDGMTVYRNEEAVLVANNQGVYAEDLHATTYLIIGRNSRFEDYVNINNEERTGCFWIGQ